LIRRAAYQVSCLCIFAGDSNSSEMLFSFVENSLPINMTTESFVDQNSIRIFSVNKFVEDGTSGK